MGTIGETIRKALAGMTAVMVLGAGFPHFACQCPNGQIKPYCLSIVTKQNGCCCGGACCSGLPTVTESDQDDLAKPSGNQDECACCRGHEQAPPQALPSSYSQLTTTACLKIWAPSDDLAPAPPKTTVPPDVTPGIGLLASSVPVIHLPLLAHTEIAWQSHQIAPPADRVTLFQHFLI